MRIEMGTVVPEKGTIVQLRPETVGYRGTLAMALRLELGSTHRAIKTAMRWTGASERTVEYWFAEERGPSGEHLIRLARHSDRVFRMVLIGAGRCDDADPEMRETIAKTRWRTLRRGRPGVQGTGPWPSPEVSPGVPPGPPSSRRPAVGHCRTHLLWRRASDPLRSPVRGTGLSQSLALYSLAI